MKLGSVIAAYRAVHQINIRALAKEIGTSFPTLSRIERGKSCDAATLIKILAWLFKEGDTHEPR